MLNETKKTQPVKKIKRDKIKHIEQTHKTEFTFKKRHIAVFKDRWIGMVAFVYSVVLWCVLINEACIKDANGKINLISGHFLEYFTNITNILCALWLSLFALSFILKSTLYDKFIRNNTIILTFVGGIILTFTVVAFWEFPIWKGIWLTEGISGTRCFTHLITPIVMLVIFYCMDCCGKFSWKKCFLTILYPIAYFLYIVLRHVIANDSWAPYQFIAYWDKSPDSLYGSMSKITSTFVYICVVVVIAVVFYSMTYVIWRFKGKKEIL
ncbi:MAG: hypothetical protein Ta2E_06680 [Mycoplasmoidaceae bacterium]|nr:MAG: hypothetical protein Ta2E_06680 [Mycoplasmoidaceae bacterium]